MTIDIKQNNENGPNQAHVTNSGNSFTSTVNKKFIWRKRGEGFISGIIATVIAELIVWVITHK